MYLGDIISEQLEKHEIVLSIDTDGAWAPDAWLRSRRDLIAMLSSEGLLNEMGYPYTDKNSAAKISTSKRIIELAELNNIRRLLITVKCRRGDIIVYNGKAQLFTEELAGKDLGHNCRLYFVRD